VRSLLNKPKKIVDHPEKRGKRRDDQQVGGKKEVVLIVQGVRQAVKGQPEPSSNVSKKRGALAVTRSFQGEKGDGDSFSQVNTVKGKLSTAQSLESSAVGSRKSRATNHTQREPAKVSARTENGKFFPRKKKNCCHLGKAIREKPRMEGKKFSRHGKKREHILGGGERKKGEDTIVSNCKVGSFPWGDRKSGFLPV